MFEKVDLKFKEETDQRNSLVDELNQQIEKLQLQIDQIIEREFTFHNDVKIKSQEPIYNELYFPQKDIYNYYYEDSKYLLNYEQKQFNEPRMVTFKQLRDIFFQLLNTSNCQQRIKESEDEIKKLDTRCYKLSYDDEQMANKIASNIKQNIKSFEDLSKELQNIAQELRNKNEEAHAKINATSNTVKRLKQYAEQSKEYQDMMINKTEGIISRVNKVRDNLMDELKKSKEELTLKIDETDKYCVDQLDILQSSIERNRLQLKEAISKAKEDNNNSMKKECDDVRNYVNVTKSEIYDNRESLNIIYNDKLRKVKEICVQFFNKAESEIRSCNERQKHFDTKLEEWAKLIIQPQELNQARLFSIETRLQENENSRIIDVDFLKETFKKLIYAIEQQTNFSNHQVDKDKILSGAGQLLKSTAGQSKRAQTSIMLKGQQENEEGPLPNLMITKTSLQNENNRTIILPSKRKQDNGIGFGNRQQISTGFEYTKPHYENTAPSSPINLTKNNQDILFLKRLLFIKASIDKEQTLDSNTIEPYPQSAKNRDVRAQSVVKTIEFENQLHKDSSQDLTRVQSQSRRKLSLPNEVLLLQENENDDFKQSQTLQYNNLNTGNNQQLLTLKGIYQKQQSLELQEYLDFNTGLDYNKVKQNLEHQKRVNRTSQLSTRIENINDKVNKNNNNNEISLENKIKKNKYITEDDIQNDANKNYIKEKQQRMKALNEESYQNIRINKDQTKSQHKDLKI